MGDNVVEKRVTGGDGEVVGGNGRRCGEEEREGAGRGGVVRRRGCREGKSSDLEDCLGSWAG